jgi:hypothetical protein
VPELKHRTHEGKKPDGMLRRETMLRFSYNMSDNYHNDVLRERKERIYPVIRIGQGQQINTLLFVDAGIAQSV